MKEQVKNEKRNIVREQIVIDASNTPMGRIASYAVKQAFLGKKVAIVNCNNAIITGNIGMNVEDYSQKRRRGKGSQKGPNYSRVPEKIVKRCVRGMLHYRYQRGLDAFNRVKCYNEVPLEFSASKKISLAREMRVKSIKLSDLSVRI